MSAANSPGLCVGWKTAEIRAGDPGSKSTAIFPASLAKLAIRHTLEVRRDRRGTLGR